MNDEDFDRVTAPKRLYRGDISLLERTAREESARRQRTVTVAEVVHELAEPLRLAEAAKGQGDGHSR